MIKNRKNKIIGGLAIFYGLSLLNSMFPFVRFSFPWLNHLFELFVVLIPVVLFIIGVLFYRKWIRIVLVVVLAPFVIFSIFLSVFGWWNFFRLIDPQVGPTIFGPNIHCIQEISGKYSLIRLYQEKNESGDQKILLRQEKTLVPGIVMVKDLYSEWVSQVPRVYVTSSQGLQLNGVYFHIKRYLYIGGPDFFEMPVINGLLTDNVVLQAIYHGVANDKGVKWDRIKDQALWRDWAGWEGDNKLAQFESSVLLKECQEIKEQWTCFVLTQSKPIEWIKRGWGCHTCSVILGGAVLVQNHDGWQFVIKQPFIDDVGLNGTEPEITPVFIGHDQIGFWLNTQDIHMGYTISFLSLVTIINSNFELVFAIDTYEDNKGICDNPDFAPCYQYKSDVSLIPDRTKQLDDIKVVRHGTMLSEDYKTVISADKVSRY